MINTKPGENVTFTLSYEPNITVNQVIWKRIRPDRMDFIVCCVNSNMPIYGSDYQDRAKTDCAMNTNNTSVVLWNITASDSGKYHCSYTGANGRNASGWIELNVTGRVAKSHPTHRDPTDNIPPGLPVVHHLPDST
ncbi:hypothetical protein EYD10_08638 [Varanus komodoensis]|nr:hypothetical protein EYD10_08638 [Varanus komodoensis]